MYRSSRGGRPALALSGQVVAGGERLDAVTVRSDGLEGDRRFAIYDVASGLGLTGRRVPDLLFASARLPADGTAEITLPDGSVAGGDDGLTAWLGRPVTLRSAETGVPRRYESVVDFEHEPTSAWETFDGAPGRSTTTRLRGYHSFRRRA